MPRVKLIQTKADLEPEHHALFDELAALRGRVSGPSTVVLHSPGLARPWNQISEFLHRDSIVEPRAAELAVCTTASEQDCSYIWNAHVNPARQAGVAEATIAAVREHRELDATTPTEDAAIVSYVRQLLRTNRVDDGAFAALLNAHDARWLVELTSWIGRYAALAGILNAFEVAPAAGAEVLPERAPGARPGAPARPLGEKPRIAQLTSHDQVPESSRPVFDAVAEGRGSVRGPFSLLMHTPEVCKRILDLSNYLRFDSLLSPYLRELATIATAREKDCPYVWSAHAPAAREAAVPSETVEAVRRRAALSSLPQPDTDVVDYARQLLETHRVSRDLFDRMEAKHGVPRLVEITALIGNYSFVSGLLNAVEVRPAPGGEALD
jgi:4-carboxymuconolactone decarboxylase